jgi:hypothetical protein
MDERELRTQWDALDPEPRRQLEEVAWILDDVVLPDALAAQLPETWTLTIYMWFGEKQLPPPADALRVTRLTNVVRDFIRSLPE